MKTLVIAEKPSVAGDIARALKVPKKDRETFEDDHYVVSSATGHLAELFMPDDYRKEWRMWTLEALPIIPEAFRLKPRADSVERFKLLERLIRRKDVDEVINACDAGREGELIFQYIVELAGGAKTVKRLWLSSMTAPAIRQGFGQLRDSSEMRDLGMAARCRSESDWLVGINGTRAFTRRLFGNRTGQTANVGRVQTPTLAMLADRERAIREFIRRDFWEVHGEFAVAAGTYTSRWFDPAFKKPVGDPDPDLKAERIWEKARAEGIVAKCAGRPAKVSEEVKPASQAPPYLYDLTSLQRDANSRLGMSAKRALDVAQRLYEGRKMLTYPRTDSRRLPEDYLPTVKATMDSLANGLAAPLGPHAAQALAQNWVVFQRRIFDNSLVSDHFAIIPTGEIVENLTPDESRIYDMVARRFIAAFFPTARFEVTTRITEVEAELFKFEGKVLREAGWLAVYGKEEQGGDNPNLAPLAKGETTARTKVVHVEEFTTVPPPRYTEATLLTAMETAGKQLDDEDLREAMKERGLGTPATRAAIVEGLIGSSLATREKRELAPTAMGEMLVNLLRKIKADILVSPALTGEWEYKLRLMEQGQLTREAFMEQIVKLTRDLVDKVKGYEERDLGAGPLGIACPLCGAEVMESMRAYECAKVSREGEGCTLRVFKVIGNRGVSPDEARALITKGEIGPLTGFVSRFGKPYAASLKLNGGKVEFIFPERDGDAANGGAASAPVSTDPVGPCPSCKANVLEHPNFYACEKAVGEKPACGFRFSRKLLEREIDRAQATKALNEGQTDVLDGFVSKKKRKFKAVIAFDKKGKLLWKFPERAPREKAPKPAGEAAPRAKRPTARRGAVSKQPAAGPADVEG